MIVSEPHLSFHCFFCGKQFDRQGGWAPQFEARLIAHLTANGLPTPDRNAQGLLPRD
jgi:hypothetical protein